MYTVMIVDDEYPARNMLDLMIDWEQAGFRLAAKAENGRQGLKLWEQYHPDIIITDIQMPVLDGIGMMEEIIKKNENQYFVILSCHESFDYAQKAIRLGVKDYLIKDMLTEEHFAKCLARAREYLDLNAPARRPYVKLTGRNDLDLLKDVYPIYIARSQNRLNRFQNRLMAGQYDAAAEIVRDLYQAPFDGIARYHYLQHINDCIYTAILSLCEKNQIPVSLITGEERDMEELIFDAMAEDTGCEMLCSWLEALKCSESEPADYSSRIRLVVSYLQENYFCDISLQSVAEHFGIHKVYLARTFKAETGKTLNEMLSEIRIEKAKLLLTMTEDSTNDIAVTVGFNNSQSFYHAFKKETDMSPGEYRRQRRDTISKLTEPAE